MNNDTVIRVENLSKQYRIGAREAGYRTFRETLVDSAKAPFQRIARLFNLQSSIVNHQSEETIWALRNVSFEVKRGEVVGIIGRNGAGKSTLLKILSKITEPTEGRVELRGRIGSLLEVGTGFHPELTGHENVYLYGAILGMNRWEITRKFDEIIAFAEMEKFIDTPVKRYSSGMYMRLAFAVAAHLEPEILLVDEVLAVGDAAFQKKCLGKMGEVSKEGRTVLFVSHNMGAISTLCETGIFLNEGRVSKVGKASEIISLYLSSLFEVSKYSIQDRKDRDGTGKARITSIYFAGIDGEPLQELVSGYECTLVLGYKSIDPLRMPTFKFTVYNSIGQPLLHFDSSLVETPFKLLSRSGYVGCRFRRLPLSRGTYRLNVSVEENGQLLDHVTEAYSFNVGDGTFYSTGRNIVGLKEVCLVEQEWLLFDKIIALTTKCKE